ncbi:MAG: ComEC/Rec2 family competence protein, partial [Candidatus Brocadiae bacterium]|nr:ComEC/Rec2 family competence protein [Candidatus Brocadiia bacterium]
MVRFRTKPPWHLENLPLEEGTPYRLRGRITREPRVHYRESPFALEGARPGKFWLLRVELERLSGDGERWHRAAGGVTVFVNWGRPALEVGDRVQFLARLSKNRRPANPGERDRALTYDRAGSHATASVASAAALKLLRRPAWCRSVPIAVGRLRTFLWSRVERRLEQHDGAGASLVTALLFGQRGALTAEQTTLFKESGSLHFLAISGLHVGIFCIFVQSLFTLIGLPVRIRSLVTILLIWLYVLFTGCHVSAARTGWMLSIVLAAPLVRRQRDSISALAAAAFLLLLLWPQQLFSAGFQLTFVAVWPIVCIYPQLGGILWPWEDLLARLHRPE